MDLDNKPNMKGTRIGSGYMVVRYVDSDWWWTGMYMWTRIGGGQADVYVDSDWWLTGGCICGLGLVVDRRMYMWTRIGGICGLGLVVDRGTFFPETYSGKETQIGN